MMRRRRIGKLGQAISMLGVLGAAFVCGACAGGAGAPISPAKPATEPAAKPATESAAKPVTESAATQAVESEMGKATESAVGQASDHPVPIRIDGEKLAGVGLEEYPALPSEVVLEGGSAHRGHIFFSGDEIVVEVWEADASTLAISEPFPYDEFVTILSGKLVLVDEVGTKTEYVAGESLVIPKGFLGTWQMIGNYRELVVIEKEAYVREEGGE